MINILISATVAALLSCITYAVYSDMVSEKYEIRKDQFKCTKTSTQFHMTQSGNQVIPYYIETCDQYTRISTLDN